MPVPVWDCSDLSLMDEPLDTVLSDDIWKKFDLDEPLDMAYVHGHHGTTTNNLGEVKTIATMTTMMMNSTYDECMNNVTLPEIYDKVSCHESREIRHHDCMWAGLCISKEHNRTLPAKKGSQVHSKKVPAGRSLLISSRATQHQQQQLQQQQQTSASQQQMHHQHQTQQQQQQQHQGHSQKRRRDSLESDGDSARPETPQSSESETESDGEDEDEDDAEAEIEADSILSRRRMVMQQRQQEHRRIKEESEQDVTPVFKHEQISINEKLSECMSSGDTCTPKAAPVSEVTGQLVRKYQHHQQHQQQQQHQQLHERRKVEDVVVFNHQQLNGISSSQQQQQLQQQELHSNVIVKKEPENWNTLSDHCYHLNQPTSKKLEHLGVQTPSDSEEEIDVVTFEKPCRPAVLPTYPSAADQQHFQLTVNSALKEKPVTAPRPRGRPPSSGIPRKRSAQQDQKPAKRARHRTYQRRSKLTKNSPPTPAASPLKAIASTSRSGSSDDEPDTEKRSLHNNMERQRRIELRNAFEELRVLVPEVEAKEKAPKVAILRQAAVYCDMLTEIGQVTLARVTEMKRRQERLRARLSQLRRSLAMTR